MRTAFVTLSLACSLPALAQDVISLEYDRSVPMGETPELRVRANEPVRLDLSMDCGTGRITSNHRVAQGDVETIALPGRWNTADTKSCSGELAVVADTGASGSMNLSFDVSIIGALSLDATLEDIDLAGAMVTVHAARPLAEVRVRAIGVGGVIVGTGRANPNDADPRLTWYPNDQEVVKLEIEASDNQGANATLTLVPWSYAIPHEDVVFASGAHAIIGDQTPKLEEAWTDLEGVLERYGSVVDAKLYVGGYTDTVGDAGTNSALSGRRARAIAAWFRGRGFAGEISWQGFGERVLAVSTPDSTDESRNRRAVYVIAANPPTSGDFPSSNWTPLR
ncbi:MAG: outer membrane protein OmpA-like peptidoglycan-associated protein [Myxococcota bacterium]